MALNLEGFVPLIQVFDMPRALAFHRDVLGFAVVSQSAHGNDFDWGMLRLKDSLLMLNTVYYGMKQVYVSDPDGYQLCFQCNAV